MAKMVHVRITAPPDLLEALDKIAEEEEVSRAIIIRKACRELVRNRFRPTMLHESKASYNVEESCA